MIDQLLNRNALAATHLKGSGIEIAAHHQPVVVEGLKVKYVDSIDRDEILTTFVYLTDSQKAAIVDVDYYDDGETLESGFIDDESLDFIIANHFMEHCANPIKTILNHLKKLKNGGALFYAIPEKNRTNDAARENTTVLHLLDEFEGRTDPYDISHYLDLVKHTDVSASEQEIHTKAQQLKSSKSNIHYHAWEAHTFIEFISVVQAISGNFILERFFPYNGNEFIVILRKYQRFNRNNICF